MEIILGIVVLAVAVVLILASMKPDEFRVTRTAVIPAPAPVVYAQVNDVHKFQEWSPWARMEPDAKYEFKGPAAGPGAAISWEGKKTGAGTMTLTENRPAELVRFQLDFLKPFKATNTAEFTFTPQGNNTSVTWS